MGTTKKDGGGYFVNGDRSGRGRGDVGGWGGGRDGRRDGWFGGHSGRGYGRDYFCGCHRPRHECHHHHHSSFWMGFGFCSGYPYYPYYPAYPVYPVYSWPVYDVVYAPPAYAVAAPATVVVPQQAGVLAQPDMTGEQAGAYATVPPGQQPADQQAQPPGEPQSSTSPPAGTGPLAQSQAPSMSVEEMDRLMKAGVEAFSAGNYEEASQDFMKVAMAMPDNVDAQLAYAVSRFAAGDYANAATAIRRAVRQVPDVVNSLFDLRDRYGKMSDFDGQVANLVRYVNEKRDDIDGWLVLGFVQHFIGDRPHAKETFTGIKKRSKADEDVADAFLNAKSLEQLAKEAQAQQEQSQVPQGQSDDGDGSSAAPEGRPSVPAEQSPSGSSPSVAPGGATTPPAGSGQSGDFSDPFGARQSGSSGAERAVELVLPGGGN